MKAIIVQDVNRLATWDIPEPEPGDYQAKARVLAGSICNSTDAKILHGEFAGPFPTILGHEVVGEVVEVGPKARHYKVGDIVTRPRLGAVPELGLSCSFGGFVEYGLVTDQWAIAEDKGQEPPQHAQTVSTSDWDPMTLTQAITLKETLSFLYNFGVKKGDSLLIFGTGPVGLSFSMLARHLGCDPVIVVGRRDEACQKAIDFGRATHTINNRKENVPDAVRKITGNGVSHSIEAIGENDVLRDCLDSLAPGGKVGIYGVPPRSQGRSDLLDDPRVSKAGPREGMAHKEISRLIKDGTIPALEFVTHQVDIADCARGFELLASRKAFKVGLRF